MFKQVLRCLNLFYHQDLHCLVNFFLVLLCHILPTLILKVIDFQIWYTF